MDPHTQPSARSSTGLEASPLTDEEIAYHEAGHAVVHLLNGGTISRVAIEGTSPGPRDLDAPTTEAAARRRAATALAGEAAGAIHHEHRLRAAAQADYHAAERAFANVLSDAAAVERGITDEAANVRERLSHPDVWRQVEAVAAALIRRRALNGEEVRRLLAARRAP